MTEAPKKIWAWRKREQISLGHTRMAFNWISGQIPEPKHDGTDFLAGYTHDAEVQRLVAEARAERVTVRPLIWEAEDDRPTCLDAVGCDKLYRVLVRSDGRAVLRPNASRTEETQHPSEDAAKAAAQADYETRILSALSDAPPRQVTLQEADVSASYLLEWMTHHHLPLQLWQEDDGSWVVVDNSTGSVWGSGETAEIALRAALRALANGGDD